MKAILGILISIFSFSLIKELALIRQPKGTTFITLINNSFWHIIFLYSKQSCVFMKHIFSRILKLNFIYNFSKYILKHLFFRSCLEIFLPSKLVSGRIWDVCTLSFSPFCCCSSFFFFWSQHYIYIFSAWNKFSVI